MIFHQLLMDIKITGTSLIPPCYIYYVYSRDMKEPGYSEFASRFSLFSRFLLLASRLLAQLLS